MTIKGRGHRQLAVAHKAAVLLLGLLPGAVSTSDPAAIAPACVRAMDATPVDHPGRCYAAVGDDAADYYLAALSGGRQTGNPGGLLAEPIVARLVDEAGNGVAGWRITFAVRRGCGRLVDARGIETRHLILRTDARGDAAAAFRLGSCRSPRIELVCAYAPGAQRPVRFILSTAASSAAASTVHTRSTQPETETEQE